ncbi:MAG: histidine phosphatase family protein, partial [Thermoplasmatota archaeon]
DAKIIKPSENILNNLKNNFKDIKIILSSPLRRALETADLVKNEKAVIKPEKELVEIDYGLAEGKDLNYLRNKFPTLIKTWNEKIDARFPNGENYNDVLKRLLKLNSKLKKIKEKEVLIVTHNVVIRVLLGHTLNIPMHLWFKIKIPYGETIEFLFSKNSRFHLNSAETIEKIYQQIYDLK